MDMVVVPTNLMDMVVPTNLMDTVVPTNLMDMVVLPTNLREPLPRRRVLIITKCALNTPKREIASFILTGWVIWRLDARGLAAYALQNPRLRAKTSSISVLIIKQV